MIWTASTTCEDGRDETLLGPNTHDERGDERDPINDDQPVPAGAEKVGSAQIPGETMCDLGVVGDAEPVFPDSRSAMSSVTSGVSTALATLAKHCPTPLGWNTKSKRRYSALETEDSLKITGRRRRLIGLSHPRQEEVLFAWLTHALVPSDAPGPHKEVSQNPRDSEVAAALQESIVHISVKRRKTAHRVSLTSIPEVDERWSYWLTRPLRTPWTFGASPGMDPLSPTSPPSRSSTPSNPVAPSAYASCFASPHRPPSVIRWKLC
ncbi:hypothetical protein M405DRAFT_821495 [Rhizopogon salebrosus TDB-379]|nr:hypothetical protein M405DRAFT_821495 [Rhizopogon salebrosus TDB-379]